MAITISGSGITSANIADGTIVDEDVADVAASKLTGALPAIDGSALTGVGGAAGSSSFQAKLAGTQTVYTSTWTKINMSNEDIDDGGNYDTSNYRFTAPATGLYYIYIGATLTGFNGTNDKAYLRAYVNGNQPANNHSESVYASWNATNTHAQLSTTGLLSLTLGDYVEVYIYETAGTRDLTTSGSNFMGFRLT